jgi:hypothetical protein
MASEEKEPMQLFQGTLDLIVLRTLASMGAQHAYQITTQCFLVRREWYFFPKYHSRLITSLD